MLSAHDADIVRRDANLPGLSVLLDSDAFVDVLSRGFPLLAPASAEIQYLRYKPGTSCLCAYRVNGAAGPCHVYAKAFTPARGEKLRHWRSAAGSEADRSRGASEEWHLGISRFPDDRRLKALGRLQRQAKRDRIVSAAFGWTAPKGSSRLRTIRYKPERRYVAVVTAAGQEAVILKMYDSRGFRSARARARTFSSRDVLLVPTCIGDCDSYRLLGFEWISGRGLRDELCGDGARAALELAGAALAELHEQYAPALTNRTASAASAIRAAAESVAAVAPRLAKRVRSLADGVAARLGDTGGEARPSHGDFNAEQVILAEAGAAILDFDRACLSNPAADFGTFAAHLQHEAARGVFPVEEAEACTEALLAGYGRRRPVPAAGEMQTFTAAALLRLAPEPFRRHDRAWHELTEALLDRTAQALASPAVRRRLKRAPRIHPAPGSGGDRPKAVDHAPDLASDPAWSFLRAALDPLEARAHLDAPLSRADATHATLRAIRVSRYKPGRRCIVEYTFDAGSRTDTGPLAILGKVSVKGLNANAHFALESLWDAGFAPSCSSVCVPQPLGAVPAWRMTLQRKVAGVPASERLTGADGACVAARVAEAIHELHTRGVPPAWRHTIDDELQILRTRLHRIRERAGVERIERLLERCERLASELRPCRPQPIHRDFYPEHVLIDGGRLWLIDLDLYCAGDPALDVGNFIAHMIEARFRRDDFAVEPTDAESTLETRYVELAGRDALPAIRAYTTLSLARHVQLSTEYPDRDHTTDALLELCEARLSAGLGSKLYG